MALPAQLEEQLAAALAQERAKVEADERAAFDGPTRTSARAGRALYNVHLGRAAKVRAGTDLAAFESLYRDISEEVQLPSLILSEADRRTFGGAVREIGGGIVRDTGRVLEGTARAATDTGKGLALLAKYLPLVLVGLAVLFVVVLARRVRA